jgi:16S rRNA (guanine(966)-N(2))-methyltransferase RsmD
VRIIGGTLKRRKLSPLRGLGVRPTTDYLRESIFNILAGSVEGAVVLDLFAGTGSLGIEALSRGASSAVFIDKAPQAIKALLRNISAFSLEKRCTVVRRDILRGLSFLESTGHGFDLVFVDPPYDHGLVKPTLHLLDRAECMAEGGLVVVEHSLVETLPEKVEGFRRIDQRQHGKTLVSFIECVMKQLETRRANST